MHVGWLGLQLPRSSWNIGKRRYKVFSLGKLARSSKIYVASGKWSYWKAI